MFPVPAVNEVRLNPPAAAGVEDVNPPPGFEIVSVSGYLTITIPEPPDPPEATEEL
jgi:hypothetical protein